MTGQPNTPLQQTTGASVERDCELICAVRG